MDYRTQLTGPLFDQGNHKAFVPMLVFLLWQIWKSRNSLTFRNESTNFQGVISVALHSMEDFSNAHSLPNPSDHLITESPQQWNPTPHNPAPPDMIKINFDGATTEHLKIGAYAAVAKDHTGTICGWSCNRLPAIYDPLTCEAIACKEKILLAKAKGFSQIIIEGDSLQVTRSLQG
ncbi:hypothetical protein P3X46_011043 [Hevea brasiliensis]|uniref:RNase H type-1 domain-containing protein n=2 Tax=Hevea brasiliensis TaxID=3981 RepID=A0ABQ9MIN4_HEVBR|nr:hypothetical protein P3X46_011043 [Hevea brasiliensis]